MFSFFRRRGRFVPARFGPECEWQGDALTVRSGPLAGRTFVLTRDVTPTRADFVLKPTSAEVGAADGQDEVCGHCHFDRDAKTGLEILWDIVVHPGFRRGGLAALLVRAGFRALFEEPGPHWFGMRKLMKVDTRRAELHNVGIGLVAVRLGFRPERGLDEMLTARAVKDVAIMPGTADSPPGLMIHLARLPGVVVAAELEKEGPDGRARPVADAARYRRFCNAAQMVRLARQGEWLIGNVDYVLEYEHRESFCRHIADTPAEFGRFGRSLDVGARKLGMQRRN